MKDANAQWVLIVLPVYLATTLIWDPVSPSALIIILLILQMIVV